MEATITLDGGTIVNLLLAILAAGVTVLVLYRLMSRDMRERFELMSRDTKERFDRIESEIKRLDSDIKSHVVRIEGNVLRIAMGGRPSQSDESLSEGASPITLTPRGERIAEKIGAKAIAEKYADKVMIPDRPSKLAIHNACWFYAMFNLDSAMGPEEKERVENALFEEGISGVDAAFELFGVLLRDCLFERRGIEVPKRKPKGEQTPPPPSQQQTQQSHPRT